MDVSSQTSRRKKPSPWWLLCLVPFSSLAVSGTLAPRVEVYTSLVCKALKPATSDQHPSPVLANWSHATTLLPNHPSSRVLDINIPFEPETEISSIQDKRCASDPVVQAATASLIAIITTITGVLSCLTGAWWGAFSDRHSRPKVLGIIVMGAFVTDVNLILVTLFTNMFPGGYWFLIAGPVTEGLLGGMTGASAVVYAYVADTATEEARSGIFSLVLGLSFVGVALGPVIGSLLTKSTGQVLSMFFLSAVIHLASILYTWFVVPESLIKDRIQVTREDPESQRGQLVKSLTSQIKKFLDPLIIFIPRKNNNPLQRGNKNWNLTLVALIYGLTHLLTGSANYTFQYLAYAFNWNSVTLGYYIGFLGGIRTICLLVIIPASTKFLQPKARTVEHSTQLSEEEPLLSAQSTPSTSGSTAGKPKGLDSPSLDMKIAYVSLIIEAVAYISMGLSRSSPIFWLSAVLMALGSGFIPTLQNIALTAYMRNGGTETGKLFGALSVLLALSSQIIGPPMYGAIYAKTVGWFPQSIFFVSMIIVLASVVLLCFVRFPKVVPQDEAVNANSENSSLAAAESR